MINEIPKHPTPNISNIYIIIFKNCIDYKKTNLLNSTFLSNSFISLLLLF